MINFFMFTKEGDVFTTLPMPNKDSSGDRMHHLYPQKIQFKLPKKSNILYATSEEEYQPEICFIQSNHILFYNLLYNEPSRKSIKVKFTHEDVQCAKFSPKAEAGIIQLKNGELYLIEPNNSFYDVSEIEYRIEKVVFPRDNNVLDFAVDRSAYSGTSFAILYENQSIYCRGPFLNELDLDLHEGPSVFKVNPVNAGSVHQLIFESGKLMGYNRDFKLLSFILEKKKTLTTVIEFPFNQILIPLFNSLSQDIIKYYLISSEGLIYFSKDEINYAISNFQDLTKIRIPLKNNESILTIQYNKKLHILNVLTTEGKVFCLGDNKEARMGIGYTMDQTITQPIFLNPYFGKIPTRKEIMCLIHEGRLSLLRFIPENLRQDESLMMQAFKTFGVIEDMMSVFDISQQCLIRFMKKDSKNKYQYLQLGLHLFNKDLEAIDAMSNYFPDFIFLFHDQDLAKEVFMRHLKPLCSHYQGKGFHLDDLNTMAQFMFPKGLYSSSLLVQDISTSSSNFHDVLSELGFSYRFIKYAELIVFITPTKNTSEVINRFIRYFEQLSELVRNKIQQECDIQFIPNKVLLKDQVYSLVKHDLTILTERLLQNGKIEKHHFLQSLKKNPNLFSIKIKSLLVSTPVVSQSERTPQIDFSKILFFFSNHSRTLFVHEDSLGGFGLLYLWKNNSSHSIADSPFSFLMNNLLTSHKSFRFTYAGEYLTNNIFITNHNDLIVSARNPKEWSSAIMFDEKNPFVNIADLFPLNKDEIFLQAQFFDSESIIVQTSMNRFFYFGNENEFLSCFRINIQSLNKILFKTFRDSISKGVFDITPIINFKKGLSVNKWVCDHRQNIYILLNSAKELYQVTPDSIKVINIPLNQHEIIEDFKHHDMGLLVKTNQSRLFTTPIRVAKNIHIVTFDYDEANWTPIQEDDIFNLTEIQFPFEPNESIKTFDINVDHAIMVSSMGRVFLWGSNEKGALGIDYFKFTHILDLSFLNKGETIIHACLGKKRTFLMTNQNRMFAFGDNNDGALGDGTKVNRYKPINITYQFKG